MALDVEFDVLEPPALKERLRRASGAESDAGWGVRLVAVAKSSTQLSECCLWSRPFNGSTPKYQPFRFQKFSDWSASLDADLPACFCGGRRADHGMAVRERP
jgi:hypothetical protein